MFITIGCFSIPESSILYVEKTEGQNPFIDDGQTSIVKIYDVHFINGSNKIFYEGEETEILEKKIAENNYVVIKDENTE